MFLQFADIFPEHDKATEEIIGDKGKSEHDEVNQIVKYFVARKRAAQQRQKKHLDRAQPDGEKQQICQDELHEGKRVKRFAAGKGPCLVHEIAEEESGAESGRRAALQAEVQEIEAD